MPGFLKYGSLYGLTAVCIKTLSPEKPSPPFRTTSSSGLQSGYNRTDGNTRGTRAKKKDDRYQGESASFLPPCHTQLWVEFVV